MARTARAQAAAWGATPARTPLAAGASPSWHNHRGQRRGTTTEGSASRRGVSTTARRKIMPWRGSSCPTDASPWPTLMGTTTSPHVPVSPASIAPWMPSRRHRPDREGRRLCPRTRPVARPRVVRCRREDTAASPSPTTTTGAATVRPSWRCVILWEDGRRAGPVASTIDGCRTVSLSRPTAPERPHGGGRSARNRPHRCRSGSGECPMPTSRTYPPSDSCGTARPRPMPREWPLPGRIRTSRRIPPTLPTFSICCSRATVCRIGRSVIVASRTWPTRRRAMTRTARSTCRATPARNAVSSVPAIATSCAKSARPPSPSRGTTRYVPPSAGKSLIVSCPRSCTRRGSSP
mmetsp:Transcript_18037/g.43350  ORF Transcript_18037/g.43350 Transcript_18037/m.43350 type:complete len:349 (-) Transcript_18037:1154-2200(-)